jgi:CheY-like chemotaxis protein
LAASPHLQIVFAFISLCQGKNIRFIFACTGDQGTAPEIARRIAERYPASNRYSGTEIIQGESVAEIGILIIDDDIVSQRALKNVLDSEGWRVRIVPLASHALPELASGGWNLVIVNIALTDVRGPIFAVLRELALADSADPAGQTGEEPEEADGLELKVPTNGNEKTTSASSSRLRVLFLVPALAAKDVQPVLEREGLPYILKPYHLHDFLEKVSELLLESGAINVPIRSMRDFVAARKRAKHRRTGPKRGAMFASREDYQMTEEEMAEWERQEEVDRKKRQKE